MKKLATKLFAVIFIFILAAGCASSITAPGADLQTEQEITNNDAPAPDAIEGGSETRMNVKRPK
jgi:hypothetical protein